jgi:hypothetical protein
MFQEKMLDNGLAAMVAINGQDRCSAVSFQKRVTNHIQRSDLVRCRIDGASSRMDRVEQGARAMLFRSGQCRNCKGVTLGRPERAAGWRAAG